MKPAAGFPEEKALLRIQHASLKVHYLPNLATKLLSTLFHLKKETKQCKLKMMLGLQWYKLSSGSETFGSKEKDKAFSSPKRRMLI
mmetsp:Transcript_7729/g.14021  ORF Transcript_7729/g.14021 Transcript_7729/m.14021 type:complete len:86 (+) Transcript_7729:557-814(+)